MRFAPHTALPRVKGVHQPRDSAVFFLKTNSREGEGEEEHASPWNARRTLHQPRRCLPKKRGRRMTQKKLAPLMTAVTQDNDAHDNSENGGVEYNTCV